MDGDTSAPQGPRVRGFEETDRAAVVALWALAFPDDPPRNRPDRVIDQKLRVQPDLFLVAEVDGRVVGAGLGGYDGHRGWVYHLAVHPQARRRGIGRALVEALEDALRERGCPKLNLQVRADNAAVQGFYEALGYRVEPRISLGKVLL